MFSKHYNLLVLFFEKCHFQNALIFQASQNQTAAFGFTPIANMTSPTPVMMSGMMSPPPMMMPTIPLYTAAGMLIWNDFL
jgi:hypothetical protein